MARHSHWAQIKLKKGALDKKRGKTFSKHSHLIETAARQGGRDPGMNPSLRLAIENAKTDNMPRENIERAIKKGMGELKDALEMQEVSYEGFGPGGIALIIDALTDNKNRTNQTVRTIMQKHGGTVGAMGSTSFLFELKGTINVNLKSNPENDELEIIDAGAQDISEVNGGFIVYTTPNELAAAKSKLEEKGFKINFAELTNVPKKLLQISDPIVAKKIIHLMEALDEEEDVYNVAANFEISEQVCK